MEWDSRVEHGDSEEINCWQGGAELHVEKRKYFCRTLETSRLDRGSRCHGVDVNLNLGIKMRSDD